MPYSIEDLVEKAIQKSLLKSHPVGTIEIRVDDQNPGDLFGGTWEKIEGKFLLASSSSHTLGSSGGEEKHILSINEIPAHTHDTIFSWNATHDYRYTIPNGGNGIVGEGDPNSRPNTYIWQNSSGLWLSICIEKSTGGYQAHNNMPPFLSVNVWKRVS